MKNKILISLIALFFSMNLFSQERITIDQIVEENKGKVIYVDYWASWCKPCIKEIKKINSLHEKYMDKDIVYVYLSVDLEVKPWQKASEKLGISDEKYNLRTVTMLKSKKYRFQLKSLPCYIIFNKKGELVNNYAPRPSEKEKLYIELDKYLSQE
jgi:thiol-disulfide isomerase/thioredoxin